MKELIEKGCRAKSKQKSETFSSMTLGNEKKIVELKLECAFIFASRLPLMTKKKEAQISKRKMKREFLRMKEKRRREAQNEARLFDDWKQK